MLRYKLSISLSMFFALCSGRAGALEESCSEVRQALSHGQLAQAERLLNPLLSQKPCNGEAWALKGRLMALNGGPQQAADYYEQALKCSGTLPRDNLLEIATAFSLLHRHQEAVAILEAHLAVQADDYEFAHEAGLSYLALDNLPKACTFLSRAYEGDPQNSAYAIDYGSCLLYQQEFPKAVKFFTALTAKDPGQPEAWLFLGNARFLQGERAQALEAYSKGLAAAPHHEALLYKRARLYQKEGNYTAASADFRLLLNSADYQAKAAAALIETSLAAGEAQVAQKWLQAARRNKAIDPRQGIIYEAEILRLSGDNKGAKKILFELVNNDRSQPLAWKILLAIAQEEQDQPLIKQATAALAESSQAAKK